MIQIKRNNFFIATIIIMACFIIALITIIQSSKFQSNEIYLYSGCGYILSEPLYENTSINLYSGYGHSLSDLMYY